MEDGIRGHMAPTVVSMLKIKNECIRVVLAETLCTFIMMVRGLWEFILLLNSGSFHCIKTWIIMMMASLENSSYNFTVEYFTDDFFHCFIHSFIHDVFVLVIVIFGSHAHRCTSGQYNLIGDRPCATYFLFLERLARHTFFHYQVKLNVTMPNAKTRPINANWPVI